MATDDFMKSLGYPGKDATTAPPPGPGTAPAATAAAAPASDPNPTPDWQRSMGKGVAKSLAGTATALPKLANEGIRLASPGLADKLSDLAERVPGVHRMEEFAQEPSDNWAETAGYLGGEAGQLLMGPGELKWGAKLASKFPKAVWGGPGQGFKAVARPWLERTGRSAEGVVRGGAAGAITDPQDPAAGAVGGAALGGLAPSVGALAKSQAGQWMGGVAARNVPWAALAAVADHMGVPREWLWTAGLPELLRWYHSPVGRRLTQAGRSMARAGGRGIERADPRIAGGLAGSAGEAVEGYVPRAQDGWNADAQSGPEERQ